MPAGTTIEVSQLSKRIGAVEAVSELSFTVEPGRITGFLGPNGAGKTTTLRMLLGLVTPTAGSATFGGVAYRDLKSPLGTVGAALEPTSFHPGRSARSHLAIYAQAAGIPKPRVQTVLDTVALTDYADRRVGGYSLGMRQRLGLAGALLGDPSVLVLDEPINGLDPEGIRWIRQLLRKLADDGKTVLISSHLLTEVQQNVDEVVILSHGRLVHTGSLASLDRLETRRTIVRADDSQALTSAFGAAGYSFSTLRSGILVENAEAAEIGRVAFAAGVAVTALSQQPSGLEESFLALVGKEGGL